MKNDIFDELVVVKRSGQRVNFNGYKIAVAIKQAFDYVYETYDEKNINKVYEDVLQYIEETYNGRKTINVEDIQDIIETKLKEEKYTEVYKAFSEYRKKRAASRKVFTVKQQHKFAKAMEQIAENNALQNETSYKPIDILLKYGKTVVNEFTKSYILDSKYLRSHEEGNIYIHNLEYFPLGVLSSVHIMLNNCLEEQESLNCIEKSIKEIQNEISGEINIPGIDNLLSSWVLKRFKLYFFENISNYLKVTGFTEYINLKKIKETINKIIDINYDEELFNQFILNNNIKNIFKTAYEDAYYKISEILKNKLNSFIKNIEKEERKTSISFGTNVTHIGTLINNTIITVLEEQDPLSNLNIIFKIKKSCYEVFIEKINNLVLNGHTIYLSFIDNSYNKSNNEIEYFATGERIFENINTGIKDSNGRLLVAKTSINLSRLGLNNASNKTKFYEDLDEILEFTKNNLLLIFETIGNKNKENYKVLFNRNILDDEKLEYSGKIRKVIKNGTLLIGVAGLKECVSAMTNDEEKQYKLITEILKYLNKKCEDFSSETKLNFYINESSGHKVRKEFMALDKAIYGIRDKITDKNYYDLISNQSLLKDDYKKLANIQSLFIGGSLIKLVIPKNTSNKKLLEIIQNLVDSDIGFVKLTTNQKET